MTPISLYKIYCYDNIRLSINASVHKQLDLDSYEINGLPGKGFLPFSLCINPKRTRPDAGDSNFSYIELKCK